MEQHFQDVAQTVLPRDKNLDSFAYTKTKPKTISQVYVIRNSFYKKPYWFDENL